MFAAFLKILLLQAVIISVIIFFLKKSLQRQLVESAIYKLETLNPQALVVDMTEGTVIFYKTLSVSDKLRIQNALSKKTGRTVNINPLQDKTIKGGIIIKVGGLAIDHSLASRLKESGLAR